MRGFSFPCEGGVDHPALGRAPTLGADRRGGFPEDIRLNQPADDGVSAGGIDYLAEGVTPYGFPRHLFQAGTNQPLSDLACEAVLFGPACSVDGGLSVRPEVIAPQSRRVPDVVGSDRDQELVIGSFGPPQKS
jgi:hypothetical protein